MCTHWQSDKNTSASKVIFIVICLPTRNDKENRAVNKSERKNQTGKKHTNFKMCPHLIFIENIL